MVNASLATLTHLNPLTMSSMPYAPSCLPAHQQLPFGFVVARTQSYLPERGADFEQVLVWTVSR